MSHEEKFLNALANIGLQLNGIKDAVIEKKSLMAAFGPCPLCGEMHEIPDSRSFDRSQMGCETHSEFPSGWGTLAGTDGTIGSKVFEAGPDELETGVALTKAIEAHLREAGTLGGYDDSPLEHKVAILEKVLDVWIARVITLEAKIASLKNVAR